MDKPSWTNAPNWAEWLFQYDQDSWYWSEYEPIRNGNSWESLPGRAEYAGPGALKVKEQRPPNS